MFAVEHVLDKWFAEVTDNIKLLSENSIRSENEVCKKLEMVLLFFIINTRCAQNFIFTSIFQQESKLQELLGAVEKQNMKSINQMQEVKSAFSEKISREIQEMEGRRKHGQQQVRVSFGSCTCMI